MKGARSSLTPAKAMRKSRELLKHWESENISPVNLGVLSTFSAEFLGPYIVVASESDIPLKPSFGPFGQLEQILMDQNNPFWSDKLNSIWIALRLEDVDPSFSFDCRTLGPQEKTGRLQKLIDRVVTCFTLARERVTGPIFVSNLSLPRSLSAGLFDASDPHATLFAVMDANRQLAEKASSLSDVYIFDYCATVADSGVREWTDSKLWYLAKISCAAGNQNHFATRLCQTIAQTLRPSAKCIVLDLDNTLWGGVLGDDGIEGIALGDDYPGSVYKDFQRLFLSYQKQGILLALASKNEESTVLECLENHPDMILRKEQFSSIQVNWGSKAISLRKIAEELNIGLDSLVFVDDNPVERAHIQSAIPEVEVVDLPAAPLAYFDTLYNLTRLQKPALLAEDTARAKMYTEESKRKAARTHVADLGGFLASLEMEAKLGTVNKDTIARVHQLISKTNQFNLTTIRHSLDDLRRMAESDKHAVCWLRLKDSFGELGLVCVGIVSADEERTCVIDTFLMSCRVMGREVERAFLSYLTSQARELGAQQIVGHYVPTLKNRPTTQFYDEHGFTFATEDSEGRRTYLLPEGKSVSWPKHIAIGK